MFRKNNNEIILLTGGTGFIGSHTSVALIENGYEIVVIDNLSNSNQIILDRVERITNIRPKFYKGDVRDEILLNKIFSENKIDAVIHFAGLKSVKESVNNPDSYHDNNVGGSSILLRCMNEAGVSRFIFSSSATVYGEPDYLPIDEEHKRSAINPYGKTKLDIEDILISLAKKNPNWSIGILRYFNPIGAHETAIIGELPLGVPQNLIPFVTQTAAGIRKELSVFGDDYPTKDGTAVRDYIHVVDLAKAHIAALERLLSNSNKKDFEVFNVGTGTGSSVLEVIKAFEKVSNTTLNYKIVARREGDITSAYADTTLAKVELGWETEKTLEQALLAAWKWQLKQ